MNPVKKGIWATMTTPFTEDNHIDFPALDRLLQWYSAAGVDGVFALCYSSEILRLTVAEKEQMMRFIIEHLPKGMGLVASGHGSDNLDEQIVQLKTLRDMGAPALVLVGNRLATQEESDDIMLDRIDRIMREVPDVPLGLYECPYPFKRFFKPETMGILARTGRFVFMKETSCNIEIIRAKQKAVEGTPFGIYNANSATLLDSLNLGVAGFCGIMCNFHPDLYARLYQAFLNGEKQLAEDLQALLGVLSVYEHQYYPVNCKAYLRDEGLGFTTKSRLQDDSGFTYSMQVEINEMRRLTEIARALLKDKSFIS